MPEGHTIHRAARDHHKWFRGQKLSISSPQGRFSDGATLLNGQTCLSVEAFGKHLIYHFLRFLFPINLLQMLNPFQNPHLEVIAFSIKLISNK